jgi:Ca2+-binding EF-hand superfamily protein
MFKHALIAGTTLLIAGSALAQTKGAAALDTNNDGKVTLSEFQAGRGAQMMARLDTDKDGKLSKAEFEAMRKPKAEDAAAPAKAAEGKGAGKMWSKIDADNDGFVSKTELDGFLANRFKRMDADNDGALTTAELKPGAGRAKVGL